MLETSFPPQHAGAQGLTRDQSLVARLLSFRALPPQRSKRRSGQHPPMSIFSLMSRDDLSYSVPEKATCLTLTAVVLLEARTLEQLDDESHTAARSTERGALASQRHNRLAAISLS